MQLEIFEANFGGNLLANTSCGFPIRFRREIRAGRYCVAAALAISKGIDAIVHLGAYAGERPCETILQANIIGCYNMFEAARRMA